VRAADGRADQQRAGRPSATELNIRHPTRRPRLLPSLPVASGHPPSALPSLSLDLARAPCRSPGSLAGGWRATAATRRRAASTDRHGVCGEWDGGESVRSNSRQQKVHHPGPGDRAHNKRTANSVGVLDAMTRVRTSHHSNAIEGLDEISHTEGEGSRNDQPYHICLL
jgi:hypothetical protein